MSDLIPQKLLDVAQDISNGIPRIETVRTILSWFHAGRRGRLVTYEVQTAMRSIGLTTKPEFRFAHIDEQVAFGSRSSAQASLAADAPAIADGDVVPFVEDESAEQAPPIDVGAAQIPDVQDLVSSIVGDPTYRIGGLISDDAELLSVTSNDSLTLAITHMLANQYSQLPVLDGARTVRGKISWRSIGANFATGTDVKFVRDCIEPCETISADMSLFSAIGNILRDECVLVRDRSNLIIGIVTTHDLSMQFNKLAEPFLLLGEIENHVRRLLAGKFMKSELQKACDPSDHDREVEDMSDLSLGECIRIIENPEYWARLSVPVDRNVFTHHLELVRRIRNDVMHFDPRGTEDVELHRLRMTVALFQQLVSLKAI